MNRTCALLIEVKCREGMVPTRWGCRCSSAEFEEFSVDDSPHQFCGEACGNLFS